MKAARLKRIKPLMLFLIACLFAPLIASAHELPPVVVDAKVDQEKLSLRVPLPLEELIVELRIQLEGADADDMASEFDRLRALPPDALAAEFEPYAEPFITDFVILVGDEKVTASMDHLEIPEVGDILNPRESIMEMVAQLPDNNAPVQIGWGEGNGDLVIRQISEFGSYTGYLVNGELSEPIPRDAVAEQGAWSSFKQYIHTGFVHIIPKGLDHILFVLGLFFFALAWRPLILQITTFTIAHSITLFMAALGWVNVPSSIVEPLIAASIIFIAIENIMTKSRTVGRRRLAIIFGFGLLHGLGFASVLGEIGLDPFHLFISLIGFNVGVEFGQLVVVGMAFIAVSILFFIDAIIRRGKVSIPDWYRRAIEIPFSLLIAIIAAYWLIERVFL